MKRALAVVAVMGLAVAIGWWLWPRTELDPSPEPAATGGRDATAVGSTASAPIDTSRVRKLAPEERRRLGEQIRAAIERSRNASTSSAAQPRGSAPTLPDEPDMKLEDVTKELQAALANSLPLVAKCYEQHSTATEALAKMTMISDPELGTVIDTEEITGPNGKPIDPKLDECMRDTIDSLGLPPLGKPGKLKVQYTFRLGDE